MHGQSSKNRANDSPIEYSDLALSTNEQVVFEISYFDNVFRGFFF